MEMKTIPEQFISEMNKIFDNFMWKMINEPSKETYVPFPGS